MTSPTAPQHPSAPVAAHASISVARIAPWVVFLLLWVVYALTIEKRDLHHYSLHHKGAEVIGEHHRFWFREHAPGQTAGGDAFVHDGRVYPNKQPGSLMAGGLVYAAIRPLGASYLDSYFLTAALVTLFTTALSTAVAAALLYRIALQWTGDAGWALLPALAYGLGSIAWPYSGTIHHDAMAAALLVAAFWWRERRPVAAGLCLGLAVTTSLLPSAMLAVLAIGFVLTQPRRGGPPEAAGDGATAPGIRRRWLEAATADGFAPRLAAGIALGLAPLVVYNTVSFGHPLGQAVIVSGQWREVAPRFDVAGFIALAARYALLLAGFTPILLLGLIGLGLLPSVRRAERRLLATGIAVHFSFVLVLGATGACQFGPRMLLPAMPFAALGLAGFATLPRRGTMAATLGAICAVSIGFNVLGAAYGTMNCVHDRWAVARYFEAARQGAGSSFPLLEALGVPAGDASRAIERERGASFAEEAREAVGRGDLDEAHRRLDAAARMAPDLARVHHYRANVAYLEGDLVGAAAALERALALEPRDALLRENLERLRARIASEDGGRTTPP